VKWGQTTRMFTTGRGSGQTASVSDPDATVPRIVLAAGTASGAGTSIALTAALRGLARLDADVTAIVARPSTVAAPLSITVRPVGRPTAILGELIGRGDAHVYIGFADRLPLVGRGGRHQVLVVQNPHLYQSPDQGWSVARRLKFGVLAMWARRSLRRADKVVCSTAASRDAVSSASGRPASGIEVVPIPAIDIDVTKATQAELIGRLVVVGDRYPYKRTVDAVDAATEFAARTDRTIEVTLVGRDRDAATEAELDAAITRATTAGAEVTVLGTVPHARALAEMAAADVLMLTSTAETQGIPLVEAHAIGLPVVCREIGAFLDLGGDAVQLVELSGAGTEFADALVAIAERSERERLAAAGRVLHPSTDVWQLLSPADLAQDAARR